MAEKIYNKPMKMYSLGRFARWVGEWSYGVSIGGDFRRGKGTIFTLWFFKLIDLPPQGEMLMRGRDYKGFNLSIGWHFEFYTYKP